MGGAIDPLELLISVGQIWWSSAESVQTFSSTKFYYAFNGVKFISNTTISVFALDNSVITQYPTPKVLPRSTDIWSIHGDCSYGDTLEPEQVTICQRLTKNILKEVKDNVLWYTIQFNIQQIMSFVIFQGNIEIGYHKTDGY